MLGECGDDTHKSRSVIKFVSLFFDNVDEVVLSGLLTRRGVSVFFSPWLCCTPDVADRSELIVAQSLFVCLCTIHVSVSRLRPRSEFVPSWVCQILFVLSSACRAEHICILTGQDCELLDQ